MNRRVIASIIVIGVGVFFWIDNPAQGQEPGPWPRNGINGPLTNHDCLEDFEACNSLVHDCINNTGQCYFCRMDDPLINKWCYRKAFSFCDTPDATPTACGLLTEGVCTVAVASACGPPYVFHNEDTCFRWRCQ